MLPGVAGDLGGNSQQLEVLPSHFQEDLALGVELECLFESLLDLVFVLVRMIVVVFMSIVVFVVTHRVNLPGYDSHWKLVSTVAGSRLWIGPGHGDSTSFSLFQPLEGAAVAAEVCGRASSGL